jgi:hypothetical protein
MSKVSYYFMRRLEKIRIFLAKRVNQSAVTIRRQNVKKLRNKRARDEFGSLILKNYEDTEWSKLLNDPEVHDPTTKIGKKFRRRFRVPYPVFVDLLEMAKALGFEEYPKSAAGIPGVPLKLKLLGVLRVLGRGTCFDGIEELAKADEETYRTFFHDFCSKFCRRFYADWVYTPRNEEELFGTLAQHRRFVFQTEFLEEKFSRR